MAGVGGCGGGTLTTHNTYRTGTFAVAVSVAYMTYDHMTYDI